MSFVAIIPARKGSKRLPNKNLMPLGGVPLVSRAINLAKKVPAIDQIIVSSDCPKIGALAIEQEVIWHKRQASLATDSAKTIDVVRAICSEIDTVDNTILLQPTSPFRAPSHVSEAIALFNNKSADAVVSVSEVHPPIQWCGAIGKDLSMDHFLSDEAIEGRSQDFPTTYGLNGAIYINKATKLSVERHLVFRKNCYAYKMPSYASVDIDTADDFALSVALVNWFDSQFQ